MNALLLYRRWLLALLAALTAFTLQVPSVMAEIVATDEVTAPSPADAERAKVQAFLERASVVDKLQTMGINAGSAKDRVAAMNQEEVHALAQRIDALPAGGAFGTTELIVILLVVILLVIVL